MFYVLFRVILLQKISLPITSSTFTQLLSSCVPSQLSHSEAATLNSNKKKKLTILAYTKTHSLGQNLVSGINQVLGEPLL